MKNHNEIDNDARELAISSLNSSLRSAEKACLHSKDNPFHEKRKNIAISYYSIYLNCLENLRLRNFFVFLFYTEKKAAKIKQKNAIKARKKIEELLNNSIYYE